VTLIEVTIAMAVFVVLAGTVLGVLIQTARTTGDNVHRTAATNLASQEIESVRNLALTAASDPLPEGTTTTVQTVGSIPYTVTRTISVASSTSGDSICASTGGTTIAYKLITVKVSWPSMGTAKPVRADTLRAIGVGQDASVTGGTAAVTVTGADGPLAGVPVTLSSAGQTLTRSSGDDGCAVFTGLRASTYTASLSAPGYVGTANTQAVTQVVTSVSSAAIARATLLYAAPRSVSVAFATPTGATPVAGIPLRAGGTYVAGSAALPICTGSPVIACTSASPGTISGLYPDTYTVTAGACVEASSSSAAVALTGRAPAAVPPVSVPLGAITVKVQTVLGAQIAGRAITVTHAAQASGCTAGETYTATSVNGGQALALPYGTWTVSTAGLTTPVTVTVSQTSRSAAATLTVIA
jgi:Tfp pilus assembly protein PilV